MPIASIGAIVKVVPADELQILRGKGDYEFVDDRSPFLVRVTDVLREDGALIGIAGPVIDGHSRYHGLIATLLKRFDDSHWVTDTHSGVLFKVGRSIAQRVSGFSHTHPEGTRIDDYPHIVRYGSIDVVG